MGNLEWIHVVFFLRTCISLRHYYCLNSFLLNTQSRRRPAEFLFSWTPRIAPRRVASGRARTQIITIFPHRKIPVPFRVPFRLRDEDASRGVGTSASCRT